MYFNFNETMPWPFLVSWWWWWYFDATYSYFTVLHFTAYKFYVLSIVLLFANFYVVTNFPYSLNKEKKNQFSFSPFCSHLKEPFFSKTWLMVNGPPLGLPASPFFSRLNPRKCKQRNRLLAQSQIKVQGFVKQD